jgi:hypothetical protein
MVGDFVLHDGKVIRVDAVHKRKIGFHKTKDRLTWLFCGQFEPILLTNSILEKNGFENQGFRHHDEYDGIDDRVVLSNYKEYMNSANEWYVRIDSEDYCTIASCELTYVHELQHILRLSKIDKEIVV